MAMDYTVCRDCGTTEGKDWWLEKPSYSGSHAAMTRCRPCYNKYWRHLYEKRRGINPEGLKAYRPRPRDPGQRNSPKGEGHTNSRGYRMVTVDGKRHREHRFVMEQHIGRPLLEHENVHHINGDRADNRLENLELWNTRQPAGQRVSDKVAWAIELLGLYAPEVLAAEPTQLRLVG